ncbi:MAG TPA: L-histidine N(alpha)-methyltransferase [Puia sp.]|nr:L-histidine N(alpha)-methyltransferase [Puia sp.]
MLSATRTEKIIEGPRLSGFYKDVMNGLRATNKYLQSKYFYDEAGDKLFQQIMACPEYYPTRCEMEILQHQSGQMASLFTRNSEPFDLVELGPGDATKSYYLLRELLKSNAEFTYYPIDISSHVIGGLEDRLPVNLPGLKLHGLNGEYLDRMERLNTFSNNRKIVLFMGANIGNMTIPQATVFCKQLHERMQPGDLLLTGFDLKKHPKIILDAYNDKQGITRSFNLNLLRRINHELGADFDMEQFEHYPVYDPGSGACKSYLISRIGQTVHLGHGESIDFGADEPIFMEISQKYSLGETDNMAGQSGFRPLHYFHDAKKWFADILWECM